MIIYGYYDFEGIFSNSINEAVSSGQVSYESFAGLSFLISLKECSPSILFAKIKKFLDNDFKDRDRLCTFSCLKVPSFLYFLSLGRWFLIYGNMRCTFSSLMI